LIITIGNTKKKFVRKILNENQLQPTLATLTPATATTAILPTILAKRITACSATIEL
jgi:hypothetical protein